MAFVIPASWVVPNQAASARFEANPSNEHALALKTSRCLSHIVRIPMTRLVGCGITKVLFGYKYPL